MRLTGDDELYYDHPIVFLRNTFEKNWSHGWRVVRRGTQRYKKERAYMKRKANQKARRAVREALKGVRPRIKKRPGDSWDVY